MSKNVLKTKTKTIQTNVTLVILLTLAVLFLQGYQWAQADQPLAFERDDTLEQIKEKIIINNYNFQVSHNWIFDMTPEEKKAFYGRRPPRDRRQSTAPIDMGPLAEIMAKTSSLPSKYDSRNRDGRSYIGPIRDQGYCGSCYAFGAAAAAEGSYNLAMGKYGSNCADFSESFIAWCLGRRSEYYDHFYGCDGADYDYYELQALVDYGITTEANFPYRESDPGSCTHMNDPRVVFQSWHRIPCGDIEAIKTAIYNYGVVDAAVLVTNAFEAYSGGIYQDSNTGCNSSPCYYADSDHAISLVGWDDSQGVFILRNSWGTYWGENGYMKIKYHSAGVACAATYLVYSSSSSNDSITVTSPNGGETLAVGSDHRITWTSSGSVGNVKIEFTSNNGSSWSTITSSTSNDGAYSWSVPNQSSSRCKIRISEAGSGSPSDASDSTFTIATDSITVTSPNGGETWAADSRHNITWTSSGSISSVKILYTTNNGSSWSTIVSSTSNDGSYRWTVPDRDSSRCKVKIVKAGASSPSDVSNSTFTITSGGSQPLPTEGYISLNRRTLHFNATTSGHHTDAQEIWLENTGGICSWTASSNKSWLSVSPSSGSGSETLSINVNPNSLSTGSYSGTITVNSNAENSPAKVTVYLVKKRSAQSELPIGVFATPTDGADVMSSIPVTGWVVDDIGVTKVEIFNGSTKIGNAVFVEDARPDIEQAYPDYPKNYKAGWGYMLLTNFLPNGGNGVYTLIAKATDVEGHVVTLGKKTIYCYNDFADRPFGALDTPGQGGVASGAGFVNWGWVLTPRPHYIPYNGRTINVWVNGKNIGQPVYNNYRDDIATLFPYYANSYGAIGYFILDTTKYSNGVHNIYWTATDSGGNTDGIGSRFFTIRNAKSSTAADGNRNRETLIMKQIALNQEFSQTRVLEMKTHSGIVGVIKGYNKEEIPELYATDMKGFININLEELERVEIHLPVIGTDSPCAGYHVAVGEYRGLPAGSQLDYRNGIFYWQPGPGFLGTYQFLFVTLDEFGQEAKVNVRVTIDHNYGLEYRTENNNPAKEMNINNTNK